MTDMGNFHKCNTYVKVQACAVTDSSFMVLQQGANNNN